MTADMIEQVALVSGRFVHRGTGRPLRGSVAIEAREGRIVTKLLDDGTFALSADPHSFVPQIAAGAVTLSLTIRATSSEFTTGATTETAAVTAVAPFPTDLGQWKLPLGASAIAANLSRTIRGSVIAAKDPKPPVSGAKVEILHAGGAIAPATTGADGRFSFDDVVVEGPAEIRVSKSTFVTQIRQLLIDFTHGMHEEHFRLVTEP
jgi:Carboxypeptidase regulatory-like domain